MFLLAYYGGATYADVYSMPITLKRWMIKRIEQELNKKGPNGEEASSASRALHTNTPDVRQMQGRARAQVPGRLRRFT